MVKKKALDKEAIFGADDLGIEKINVQKWGGALYARTMSGLERAAYEDKIGLLKPAEKTGLRIICEFLIKVLVSEKGEPIFDKKDATALMEKNAGVLLDLFRKASKINQLTETDIEDLEKN